MTYNPIDWRIIKSIASVDGRFILHCSEDLNFGRDEPLYMWSLEKPGPRGNEIPGFTWYQHPENTCANDICQVRFSKNGLAIEIVRNDESIEIQELPKCD